MAPTKFQDIGDVLTEYELYYREEDFVQPIPPTPAPLLLQEEIQFVIAKLPYKASEAAIGEMVIFPILKEAWKDFSEKLMLWSHKAISHSEASGIPDYLIARQSKRGKVVLDKPLLAVVEAKKDDFESGWAQCALEMVTMQKINEDSKIAIFGIVSNGDNWEFGKLEDKEFVRYIPPFSLFNLDELFAALIFTFNECKKAVERLGRESPNRKLEIGNQEIIMQPKFIRISPVLSSADVARDVAWWEEKTGFLTTFDDTGNGGGVPKYAGICRQDIYIHLQWHSGHSDDPIERSAVRIEVENVRPLFEEFVKRGTVKPDAFRKKTAWGTNEFGFYDLNGNAVFFFEDVK